MNLRIVKSATLGIKELISFTLVVLASVALVFVRDFLPGGFLSGSWSPLLNRHISYQLFTLALTGFVMLCLLMLHKRMFRRYFAPGNLNARVIPVRWLGINPKRGEGWKAVGRSFSIIISLVTAVLVFSAEPLRLQADPVDMLYTLPWAVLLAASNAFVEEMLTRLGVIVVLKDKLSDNGIMFVSALLFGTLHYYGTPGGIAGVLAAGFLGWLLAKSILETKGMFWALLIHFLQDVIIFCALLAE
jgi:membrane protease YdiL (CAAX protease family)